MELVVLQAACKTFQTSHLCGKRPADVWRTWAASQSDSKPPENSESRRRPTC